MIEGDVPPAAQVQGAAGGISPHLAGIGGKLNTVEKFPSLIFLAFADFIVLEV